MEEMLWICDAARFDFANCKQENFLLISCISQPVWETEVTHNSHPIAIQSDEDENKNDVCLVHFEGPYEKRKKKKRKENVFTIFSSWLAGNLIKHLYIHGIDDCRSCQKSEQSYQCRFACVHFHEHTRLSN